ncbi:TPA: hypothetical protein ACH9SP_002709 [Escherichia coli]
MTIDYQALRDAAVAVETEPMHQNFVAFRMAFTPSVALALLDEIKRLEDTNIDAMCRIAELETNLAALAVENAALKQSEKEFNNFCRQEYYGWEDNFTETPATDAFLAEVRAQGVDAAIEAAKNLVAQEYEYKDFKAAQSDCCMHPGSDLVGKVEMTEWLVDFAAQLRKGGNQ